MTKQDGIPTNHTSLYVPEGYATDDEPDDKHDWINHSGILLNNSRVAWRYGLTAGGDSRLPKTMVAGPWVGEFGYEIMAWQGFVRMLSRNFQETVVICQPGHEYMYQDFATRIVKWDMPAGNTALWQRRTQSDEAGGDSCAREAKRIMSGAGEYTHMNPYWVSTAKDMPHERWRGCSCYAQEFVKFGNRPPGRRETPKYMVIHARDTNKSHTGHVNWSRENWTELVKRFEGWDISCIGSMDGSMLIEGCDDLRGSTLENLATYLSQVDLVVGPSSGPMHFASLCCTPHLVWSAYNISRDLYTRSWNPFFTPVTVVEPEDGSKAWQTRESWSPGVDMIETEIRKMLA